MASLQNVVSEFSPNGEYFAFYEASGSLQIWETATRTRRQQYTPSAHLSESSSCMSWAPLTNTASDHVTSKKRRKSVESVDKLELIALGTVKGSILLYSRATNDLFSQLMGGHSDQVNGISWCHEDDRLFSCSSDKHIVEWSISKSSSKHKWKADDTAVHSICVCHSRQHLLSAANNIKLWDLDTRQVLQTFTGHASPVFRLLHQPYQASRKSNETTEEDISGSYVISSSHGDHHINVWRISLSSEKLIRKPVASFALPSGVVHFNVNSHQSNKLHLCSVTANGKLVLFEHSLNGHAGVLKPQLVVALKTPNDVQLPVQGASFKTDSDNSLIVAFSGENLLLPDFETLRLKELKELPANKKSEVCLVREKPVATHVSVEVSLSKLKNPEVSKDVTVIRRSDASGHVPIAVDEQEQNKPLLLETTVGDRLNAMGLIDLPAKPTDAKRTPKTDNVATLLVQGLQSEDKAMLNHVLQKRDTNIIQQTIQRLPLSAIVPLIKELKKRMGGHAQNALVARKWLKCVLMTHASYLMTLPDRTTILGELQQILEARLDVFRKICHLQGRLDLILSQIENKGRNKKPLKSEEAPQLVYKDESTDDEDNENRLKDQEMLSEDEEEWNHSDEDSDEDDDEASSSEDDHKMDVGMDNAKSAAKISSGDTLQNGGREFTPKHSAKKRQHAKVD